MKTLTEAQKRTIRQEFRRSFIVREIKKQFEQRNASILLELLSNHEKNLILKESEQEFLYTPLLEGLISALNTPKNTLKRGKNGLNEEAPPPENAPTGAPEEEKAPPTGGGSDLKSKLSPETQAQIAKNGKLKGLGDVELANAILKNRDVFDDTDEVEVMGWLKFHFGSEYSKLYDEQGNPKAAGGGAQAGGDKEYGQVRQDMQAAAKKMDDPKARSILGNIFSSYKMAFASNASMWDKIYQAINNIGTNVAPAKQEDAIENIEDKIEDTVPKDEGAPEEKSGLEKETPLSIMKKQKDVVAGKDGQKETPLVMHLQKIGLSQKSAQMIAKRVGEYLKQRKIAIAEAIANGTVDRLVERIMKYDTNNLLSEDKMTNQVRKSMLGKMRSLMVDKASDKAKDTGADMVMKAHNLAKKRDWKLFQKTILKWAEKGTLGGWIETPQGKQEFGELGEEEIRGMMSSLLQHDLFQKYHKAGYEWRKKKADAKKEKRGALRDVGKDAGVVGKIVSRFVSDNQKMLDNDEKLKAIFDDPRQFKKLVKSVANQIRRMLKRRGYETPELVKLGFLAKEPAKVKKAEQVVAEQLRYYYNKIIVEGK